MLAWANDQLDYLPIRIFFFVVAALFAFDGVVHVSNILSLSGYPWEASPLSWRIFDVVYAVLDAIVVAGVIARSGWGVLGFLASTTLQVLLYQFIPSAFAVSPEQEEIVRRLLYVALGLLVIFAALVLLRGRRANA